MMLEKIKLVADGRINESNYNEMGITKEAFDRYSLMVKLSKKYKTDKLTPFLGMSTIELYKGLSPERTSIPVQKVNRTTLHHLSKNNSYPKLRLVNKGPSLKKIIDKRVDIRSNMLFLKPEQVAENYRKIKNETPGLEIGGYLLCKTPEETQEIIDLCHEQEITFRPEFLYFDMNLCKSNLQVIDYVLLGVDATLDGLIDFDKAQEINKKLSQKLLKESQAKDNLSETSLNEYCQIPMVETTKGSNVVIQPLTSISLLKFQCDPTTAVARYIERNHPEFHESKKDVDNNQQNRQKELSEMFVEEHNTKPSATHISRAS